MTTTETDWKPSACILCECNCGVEIRLGADGRTFERVRGDKAHPASQGYTCEKALRLDYYQNGRGERVLHPLRRRPDGTFEEIDWDTAIREVAARLGEVRDTYGGETIVYYGGGGQGNHLGGTYSSATLNAFGARFRSSAIAQEKTGEAWVNGLMLGTPVRGEFEHCEVALFVGKNPWLSHGIPHARTTLKAIANDPARSMVVIDPRRTETAELADFHLQVRPGRDAWLLAALAAVLVDESLLDRDFLAARASGLEPVTAALREVPIAEYCRISGVDEDLVRAAARRIATASSVAVFEDLGVQMNRHSTLVSYLEKLVWLLTGNLGRSGAQYSPTSLASLVRTSRRELDPATAPRSPVVGARIISGLIPCNVIPDEILTDHPQRYRAMIVESGNPAHSIADSQRMRQAIEQLDVVVCIDVFMTETARLADYVLPATTQFEKYEATFFNFEFPRNVFHLRRPVVAPPDGPLPEPEIHARLVEAAGLLTADDIAPLRAAAEQGRATFAAAFAAATSADPRLGRDRPCRALPHARADPARRRRERRRAVGARPALRADEPERGAAGRLRRRAGRRRPPVRRHPRQPVGRRVHRRRVGRDVAADHDVRRPRAPGDPRAAGRADGDGRGGPARRRRAVAVPAVGGGAPLVHGEHDPARPGVAQARRGRGAAHLAGRCRRARARRR